MTPEEAIQNNESRLCHEGDVPLVPKGNHMELLYVLAVGQLTNEVTTHWRYLAVESKTMSTVLLSYLLRVSLFLPRRTGWLPRKHEHSRSYKDCLIDNRHPSPYLSPLLWCRMDTWLHVQAQCGANVAGVLACKATTRLQTTW